MKTLLVLFFYSCSICIALGQFDPTNKHMVLNNDTVPFCVQQELVITFWGDSMYRDYDPCSSFYIINGMIFNRLDEYCKKQGVWVESLAGRKWQGRYINDTMVGVWKTVDSLNNTESFSVEEYNDGILWRRSYYPDSSRMSTTDYVRSDSCCITLFQTWYKNGRRKEWVKYKFPIHKYINLPKEKFEIDTTFKWHENGNLSYMSYPGGYIYFYVNGQKDTEVIYDAMGKGIRKVIHCYDNGNLEWIRYLKETKKNYNVKYGAWEYYDRRGGLGKKVFHWRGKVVRVKKLE